MSELSDSITSAVNEGRAIKIIAYYMGEKIENHIKAVLDAILSKYQKPEFMETLYTAIKELAINATKANMKQMIFEENNLDINDEEQFQKGMKIFKDRLTEKWVAAYAHKCKEADVSVKITFFHDPNGLRVVIKNNIPIADADELRIRSKLGKVMQYEDLVQFYMDNADETEGQGLGIGLIVMLLKGENLDPHLFRIGIIDKNTTARIEIPFSEKFVSTRERKLMEQAAQKEKQQVSLE